jgi:fatty-acyl-CoA synthase
LRNTVNTITGLIDEQLSIRPDATAVIYGEHHYSYAELSELGARTAAGLKALGVGVGDRVGLWLPNTPAYLGFLLGCARLGAIATSVNTRFRSTEVADIVGRSGVKVLVMWPGFRQIDFPAILGEAPFESLRALEALVLYDEGQAPSGLPENVGHCRHVAYADLIAAEPYPDDHADAALGSNMFTTSGTTKAPKFVLHAQSSVAEHARVVARHFGYTESRGALLLGLPFCGVFGFTQALASLASGRPSVVMSAFDPALTVAVMHEHAVEHTNATDDMIQAMMAVPGGIEALARIKFIGTAAFGTDFDEFSRRAEENNITLMGLYGMSEVQALFARRPETLPFEERLTAGGTLVDDRARVRVRDPDSGALLPIGEAGELELNGPSLMKEYFGNPEATAEALTKDGFIRTGDLGYQQDERSFVFLQRMGDVLRLGGFLVSPAEIESRLQDHVSVDGAQVVGIDSASGTRPIGFVTLTADAAFDETELRAHCLAGLAKFKAPDRIYQIDAFPTTKSANGTKIQRAELRKMAEKRTLDENR